MFKVGDRVYILTSSAYNGTFGRIVDEDTKYGDHSWVVEHHDGNTGKYYDRYLFQLPNVKEG